MNTGRRGLVAQYDVICFDEVSGVSFDQKEGVNILKGYMESGEFSRGKESIRADGGIVMVGNFDVDVGAPAPHRPSLRATAEGDARRHGVHGPHPRLHPRLGRSEAGPDATSPSHFGFVSDFLAEVLEPAPSRLPPRRAPGATGVGQPAERPGPQGCQQHRRRAAASCSIPIPRWRCRTSAWPGRPTIALELRRRVKEQQAFIGADEFGQIDLAIASAAARGRRLLRRVAEAPAARSRARRQRSLTATARTAKCCPRRTRQR